MVVSNLQPSVKTQQAGLTKKTVIEKDAILIGIHKAAYIHLPRVIYECILLKMENIKISTEVEYKEIGRERLGN